MLGHQPLKGVRVLVVDDNADQLHILHAILGSAGASVRIAHSAQEAFDSFQADPADVVVSDIAMPQANGYNLLRRIRSLPKGTSVPAIAITAFHVTEHWQNAIDAGFNEWLPKPAHHVIVATVARLLGRPSGG